MQTDQFSSSQLQDYHFLVVNYFLPIFFFFPLYKHEKGTPGPAYGCSADTCSAYRENLQRSLDILLIYFPKETMN